jgi:hypothetical protein
MAASWASMDGDASLAWVQSLPNSNGKQSALASIAEEIVRSNPLQAFTIAQLLPEGYTRENLQKNLVLQSIAYGQSDQAVAWVQNLPDGAMRDRLLPDVLDGLAKQSPVDAARLAALLPGGLTQNAAIMNIVAQWSSSAPQAAADWIAMFPEGDVRNNAIQSLVGQWTMQDSAAPGKWLLSLPDSLEKQDALGSYVSQLCAYEPSLALNYVNYIQDDNIRETQMENIARSWLRIDRSSAETWLAGANLAPEVKQQLLSEPSQ